MKLEIAKEEDRLVVAAVLIKNGYTVKQTRDRPDGKKQYTYYVEAEK